MKKLILLATTILAAVSPFSASAQEANRILEGARLSATLVELDEGLEGHLSHKGRKIPITIFLKGKNIQFQYYENKAWRVFHMRLADDRYDLFEIIDGKTITFPGNKMIESIAGTDMTYEDLALRFFYWPNPKLEDTERVGTEECYRLRLDKPHGAPGRYEGVYVWIHAKYGAFMRIRGHNKNGTLVKEFQVEDVMKVGDGTWVLEKMQVATHDPRNGRRQSITDLVFKKPSDKALKGLR